MKLLRNPIVTGLLVVAAVGMVAYQIYAPRLQHAQAIFPKPVAAAVVAVAQALAPPPQLNVPHPAENEAPAELTPEANIDREFLKAHFDTWVESPLRDPFQLLGAQPLMPQEIGPDTNSPIRRLKYTGMYHQTGGKYAVIGGDPYQVGEEIRGYEGYKIVDISSDEVCFQGTNGIERLGINKIPLRTNVFPHAATAPVRQP